ncbi:hypothetical protein, partial [Nostoc sp.]|uniref:hypothetical protein n=1 Tax=Nostoc sp. TaxID=1180 RepID=UPI002FF7C869
MRLEEQVTSLVPPVALNLNQNFATVRCTDEVNISALVAWVIFNVNNTNSFWFGEQPSFHI